MRKSVARTEEINTEGVSAFDQHADGGFGSGQCGHGQRAGHHSGAAGQSLGLHASLVSANGEILRSELPDEIHIGAARLEVVMVPQGGSEFVHVNPIEIIDQDHCVRHAGVDRINRKLLARGIEFHAIGKGARFAHAE